MRANLRCHHHATPPYPALQSADTHSPQQRPPAARPPRPPVQCSTPCPLAVLLAPPIPVPPPAMHTVPAHSRPNSRPSGSHAARRPRPLPLAPPTDSGHALSPSPATPAVATPLPVAPPTGSSHAPAAMSSQLARRRPAVGAEGGAPAGAPARGDAEQGMAAPGLSLCLKLLAAAFYGLSSFLIVVVNKSVLTTYGYGLRDRGVGGGDGARDPAGLRALAAPR